MLPVDVVILEKYGGGGGGRREYWLAPGGGCRQDCAWVCCTGYRCC